MGLDLTKDEKSILIQLLAKVNVQLDQAQALMDLRDKLQKSLDED